MSPVERARIRDLVARARLAELDDVKSIDFLGETFEDRIVAAALLVRRGPCSQADARTRLEP